MSNFEEAFELTGYGKFNHIVLATSGLILFYTSMESLGIGYINSRVECDLNLSINEKSLISSATFIGIVSVAIMWGFLSDRYGRRKVMAPTLLCSAITSFSSSLSTNFWMFFVLRILTGCMVSASCATVYAYLGEMHDIKHRPSAIAWVSVLISFSFFIMPGLAWIILPGSWSFNLGPVKVLPWRVFIWSWCVPALLSFGILLMLPESPRYLLASRGVEDALPVLAKIYAWNHNTSPKNFPVKHLPPITPAVPVSFIKSIGRSFYHMLRPPLLYCVLISHFCIFMIFLLARGLYLWMPEILDNVLKNKDAAASICQVLSYKYDVPKSPRTPCEVKSTNQLLYPISMAMAGVFASTYIVNGFLIKRIGKRCMFCAIVVISSLILCLSALIPQPIVGVVFLLLGMSCGCGASVLAAILVEVFPTSLRAFSLCTLYMIGRLGAAFGANILGNVIHRNCVIVLVVNTLITAGSTLLMIIWPNQQRVRAEMESRGFTY